MRFSIAALMTTILYIGIGLGALFTPAPWFWKSAVLNLTVILIGASTLAACAEKGPRKMAWVGFSTFGWTYILLNFVLFGETVGVRAPFMTYVLKKFAEDHKELLRLRVLEEETLVIVCHSLLAVLFGLVGACLGETFSRRNAPERTQDAPE